MRYNKGLQINKKEVNQAFEIKKLKKKEETWSTIKRSLIEQGQKPEEFAKVLATIGY
jgi:hypothetical protein